MRTPVYRRRRGNLIHAENNAQQWRSTVARSLLLCCDVVGVDAVDVVSLGVLDDRPCHGARAWIQICLGDNQAWTNSGRSPATRIATEPPMLWPFSSQRSTPNSSRSRMTLAACSSME